MALILDTAELAPRERAEAVQAAMRGARVPALLTHETEERVRARMDVWDLGGSTTLLHRTGTGLTLRRTPRLVRQVAEDRYGLVVLGPGRWSFEQRGQERRAQSAHWGLVVVDQSEPYRFARHGDGTMYAVNVDHAALGLPTDEVREAADRLHTSPLATLVTEHVRAMVPGMDAPAPGPATRMLGASTLQLIRALVVSAADPGHRRPDDDAGALRAQTKIYVQRHYADPRLSAAGIARAHIVSLRRLYAVWADDRQSLAEYVMTVRLEAARSRLDTPGPHPATIASIGRACGFTDMTHFARRFRGRYGMSPREWRRQAWP